MSGVQEQEKPITDSNGSRIRNRALRSWQWLWSDTENQPTFASVLPKLEPAAPNSRGETSSAFADLGPLKIIAWLGASTGGLTILLGVIGFLASSAHDAMLGIPRSIQNNAEYVAVGGLFFARSIIFLVASFIAFRSWAVLGILLIGVVILFNIPRRRSRGKSLVINIFAVALLIAEIYGLARLIQPLQLTNLLLNLSVGPNTPSKQVADALLVNDTTWLSVEYGFLVLLVAAFSIAFVLLEQTDRTTFWRVIRVPACILILICIFLLPRSYGVSTISNDYPTVVLESSNPTGTSSPAPETRLLLREDDKVFVLYDPATQSIVTTKRDSIGQHKIYAPQHVFTASVGKK